MKTLLQLFHSVVRSPLAVVVIGIFTVFITMRSVLGPTFFRPHDFTHAARLTEMQRSLQAGEFPVRWSRNFGFGYGMPLFNFYAPLPYYLGQIPLFLGIDAVTSIKFLYLFNGLLAFVGMYLLARKFWGKWGGLVSAIVFSFSTYRALDLFVRGALGEAYALVLIPFALYGVELTAQKKKLGILITAVSLAAILLSHNLTGMVAVGLVATYGLLQLLLSKRKDWVWQISSVALGVFLAIGLGAFYILPAYFEKNLTRVEQTITVGNFDYHKHFLCSTQLFTGDWKYGGSFEGCSDDLSFAFGALAWALFGLSMMSVVILGSKKQKIVCLILLFLFGITTFMTIGRSQYIWDQISLLKYFQFPWRFLTFSHVFFSLLTGGVVLLTSKWKWIWILPVGLILALVAQHSRFYLPEKQLRPEEWNEFYNTSKEWIRAETSKTLNDYLPPSISDNALPTQMDARFSLDVGKLTIKEDTSVLATATVTCQNSCRLNVNNFQYPGWKAKVEGREVELLASGEGLPIYSLSLEPGSHEVQVQYEGTAIQTFANLISLVSFFLAFGLWFKYKHEKIN